MTSPYRPDMTLDRMVARLLDRYQREGWAPTLLGVGPMSALVVRAALEVAAEHDCPTMLIASRNQVDLASLGGGYVENWTCASFADAIRATAAEIGFDGLAYICRDHGGRWQRDEERRPDAPVPFARAMSGATESYTGDLEAGFDLLHIDPTRDPTNPVTLDIVVRRSLDLLRATEKARRERSLPSVSYEIGTEETSGGLTADTAFAGFISELLDQVKAEGLPRPAFIVGQTGTLLKMRENVGAFDADTARRLAAIARDNDLGLKEHNADYLADDVLAAHPEIGITAANVAPEYGHAETSALFALADQEAAALNAHPSAHALPSEFRAVVEQKVLTGARWPKWLRRREKDTTPADLRANAALRHEVAVTCGHYTFADPQVRAARKQLYENVAALRIAPDPQGVVLNAVKASIARYIGPLRLAGLTSWLRARR